MITTKYEDKYHTISIHESTGATIITDSPIDKNVKADSLSPTDLLTVAVTSCIFTISGQAANTSGFSIDGAKASTKKIMSKTRPIRVEEIIIDFDFSICKLDKKAQTIIKNITKSCPVVQSLHADIKKNISFIF